MIKLKESDNKKCDSTGNGMHNSLSRLHKGETRIID